jgi:hypothetical protein
MMGRTVESEEVRVFPPPVTDDRLAWLAVEPHLDRIGRRAPLGAVVAATAPPGVGDARSAVHSTRMSLYNIAVTDVAAGLRAHEVRALRNRGQVPAWFLPAVLRRYAQMRREG